MSSRQFACFLDILTNTMTLAMTYFACSNRLSNIALPQSQLTAKCHKTMHKNKNTGKVLNNRTTLETLHWITVRNRIILRVCTITFHPFLEALVLFILIAYSC